MSDEQRRAEIRKLVEQIQKALVASKLSFGPDLDRRIREQVKRQKAIKIER